MNEGGPFPQPRHADILTGGIARTPDSRSVPRGCLFPNHRGKAFLVTDLMGFCKAGKTPLVKPLPQEGCGKGEREEHGMEGRSLWGEKCQNHFKSSGICFACLQALTSLRISSLIHM